MRVTVRHLSEWKARGERFAVLTAYDYSLAKLVSQAGVPVILVGDSLGQVVLGFDSTLPVTLEDMLRHTAAAARGAGDSLVVADLPFLSYQVSREEAVRNAGRLLKEAGAHAVKLEGGEAWAPTVAALTAAGIPVMGHVGLMPQSVHLHGGYRTQATDPDGQARLLRDAQALEAAGAFAVVLEKVPDEAAGRVTKALSIPTIGCGAGPACDGQVLVLHDILGLFGDFTPPFAKRYAELGQAAVAAISAYAADVKAGTFPGAGRKPA
ncbi:MAG: 3-methyl-2-oxobutanoate hydroxymethyltransferase [candidate division FCPU426 bacterium]